jgi:hypothetical protein
MSKKHKLKKIKKRVKQMQKLLRTALLTTPSMSMHGDETLAEIKMVHAEIHEIRATVEALRLTTAHRDG